MQDRVADGRFAAKTARHSGRFKPGDKKPPNSGRKPGQQNHTTRAVKEFLAALVDDPSVQQAVKERIKKGDAVAFFRALEHVVGKPKEQTEVSFPNGIEVKWKS